VSLIGVQADDGVEVLDVERVPYRQALDLALSGAIMQTSHIASRRLPRDKGACIDNPVSDREVRIRKHAHDALHNVINARAAIHTAEHRKRVTLLAEL